MALFTVWLPLSLLLMEKEEGDTQPMSGLLRCLGRDLCFVTFETITIH